MGNLLTNLTISFSNITRHRGDSYTVVRFLVIKMVTMTTTLLFSWLFPVVIIIIINIFFPSRTTLGNFKFLRSRWPRGLRRGSAAACLLGLRVRIPPGAWMSIFC
jgi:hypothetical protein